MVLVNNSRFKDEDATPAGPPEPAPPHNMAHNIARASRKGHEFAMVWFAAYSSALEYMNLKHDGFAEGKHAPDLAAAVVADEVLKDYRQANFRPAEA